MVSKGDWVKNSDDTFPCFGQVREVHRGGTMLDIYLYDSQGNIVIHISEIGPISAFVPGLDARDWSPIKPPIFPLHKDSTGDWAHSLISILEH